MTTATKYKLYPQYKPSGIDWLGDIPEGWNTKRIRYVLNIVGGNGFPEDLQGRLGGDYPFYKVSDINGEELFLEISNNYVDKTDVLENNWKIVSKGSIVTAKIGAALSLNHRKITTKDSLIDNNMLGLSLKSRNYNSIYVFYLFKVIDMDWFVNPGAVPSVNIGQFIDAFLPSPTIEEQKEIVAFLDREAAKIDEMVAKKQKLAELLKEKRQALITHAVTKGLDPKAKMKASGISWLGNIPEGWGVKKLKYVAKSNASSLAEDTAPDYLFKYLDIGNVGTGYILEEPIGVYFENAPSRARRIVNKNDTIISTVRTYLKAIYHFEDDPKDLIVSTGFAVIETGKEINPKFFYYLSLSENFIDSIVSNSYGVSYPAINESFLMTLPVWYPKIETQKEIVAFLDKEIAQIDGVIKKVETQIEKLQEYRQALISNVVTGKVRVIQQREKI